MNAMRILGRLMTVWFVLLQASSLAVAQSVATRVNHTVRPAGTDPFVRGLIRLDTRLKLEHDEIERLKMLKDNFRRDDALTPPPDFARAFSASHYRPVGVLAAAIAETPTIHIVPHQYGRNRGIHYWQGAARRWIYRRANGETLDTIATRFTMQADDILTLNSALTEAQLDNPMQFYLSPTDNGALVHIVRRGETFARLAPRYDTKIEHLMARNKYGDKKTLQVGQRLVIREKTLTHAMIAKAASTPVKSIPPTPHFYARIQNFRTKTGAIQMANSTWQNYRAFIDADMLIRSEGQADKPKYHLDIGPMQSKRHATGWCMLIVKTHPDCAPILRYADRERQDSFRSQAIVSITPKIFYGADGVETASETNVDAAKQIEYHLFEGQVLGHGTGMITKITPHYIYITTDSGRVHELPFYYVPENDPAVVRATRIVKARALAQAAQTAAPSAEGTSSRPSTFVKSNNIETDIAPSAKTGDRKRKLGSTDALNQVLGTDFN